VTYALGVMLETFHLDYKGSTIYDPRERTCAGMTKFDRQNTSTAQPQEISQTSRWHGHHSWRCQIPAKLPVSSSGGSPVMLWNRQADSAPGCRKPDVIIDVGLDLAKWRNSYHGGRQIMALMIQQLIIQEYLRPEQDLPSWAKLRCSFCQHRSFSLCLVSP